MLDRLKVYFPKLTWTENCLESDITGECIYGKAYGHTSRDSEFKFTLEVVAKYEGLYTASVRWEFAQSSVLLWEPISCEKNDDDGLETVILALQSNLDSFIITLGQMT